MVAHDNAPFITSMRYRSKESVSNNLALLYNKELNKALSLSPLIFWSNRPHTSVPHGCFWLDKKEGDGVVVKPCDEKNSLFASDIHSSLDNVFESLYNKGITLLGTVSIEPKPGEGEGFF